MQSPSRILVSRFVMETVSGRFIDLTNPSIDDINEEDLAWGISRMPRYSTHTINELIYSVGQHSIFATETVQRAWNHKEDGIRASLMAFIERQDSLRREAMLDLWANTKQAPTLLLLGVLLHDASEAWLLDVPTPLKNLPGIKEAYGELEAQFMSLIYQKFGLDKMPDGSEGFIQWADSYTLTIAGETVVKIDVINMIRQIGGTDRVDFDVQVNPVQHRSRDL